MPSAMMTSVRQSGHATKAFSHISCAVVLGLAAFMATASPVRAHLIGPGSSLQQQIKQDNIITEVRARAGGVARRTTVVGPRGGVASRTVVRRGAVVRPGYAGGGVRWARPA